MVKNGFRPDSEGDILFRRAISGWSTMVSPRRAGQRNPGEPFMIVSGWWWMVAMFGIFPEILGIEKIIPTDEVIFFRTGWLKTTKQVLSCSGGWSLEQRSEVFSKFLGGKGGTWISIYRWNIKWALSTFKFAILIGKIAIWRCPKKYPKRGVPG